MEAYTHCPEVTGGQRSSFTLAFSEDYKTLSGVFVFNNAGIEARNFQISLQRQ